MILCPKYKTFSIRCRGDWFCPPSFTENENHLKICQLFSSYYLSVYFLLPRFLGDGSLESFWGVLSLSLPAQRSWCYGLGCGVGICIFTLPTRILTFWNSPCVGKLQSSMASQDLSKLPFTLWFSPHWLKEVTPLTRMTKQSVLELIGVLQPWTCTIWAFLFSVENPTLAKAMECTSVMQGVRDRHDSAERWWGELYLLFPSGLGSWLPLIQGEKLGTRAAPGCCLHCLEYH